MKILELLKHDLDHYTIKNLAQVDFENTNNPELVQAKQEAQDWLETNMPLCLGLITSNQKHTTTLKRQLIIACTAIHKGEIENARYNDWKYTTSSALSNITKALEFDIHGKYWDVWVKNREQARSRPQQLGYIHFESLHDIKSNHKKVVKFQKKQDDLIEYEQLQYDVRLKALTELLFLNEVNAYLKTIIVKTERSASTPKTSQEGYSICGYCFRPVRFMQKKSTVIAYHGFKRNTNSSFFREDIISGSCNGANNTSLEINHETTFQLLKDLNAQYTLSNKMIDSLSTNVNQLKSETNFDKKNVCQLEDQIRMHEYMINKDIPYRQEQAISMLTKFHPNTVDDAKAIIAQMK